MTGVLVFHDPDPSFTVQEGEGDVLVFRTDPAPTLSETTSTGDFILFDTPAAQLSELLGEEDFLLIQQEPAFTAVAQESEAETLVITSGVKGDPGPPGPAGESGASSWSDIADKPLTFPPEAHAHPYAADDDPRLSDDRRLFSLRAATATSNGNIALSGTQTVDTVALAVGDFVLVKNQTDSSENGIYIVDSGAWTRHPMFDTDTDIAGSLVRVREGSNNRGTVYQGGISGPGPNYPYSFTKIVSEALLPYLIQGKADVGHLHDDRYYTETEVDAISTADRDRANHTGTQDASTVTGLSAVATSGDAADLTGVIGTSQLPALAISDVFTVADEAAMLALTAQRGDLAIRTDLDKTFILATDSPGTLADWKEIIAPGDVLSVAGKTGVVVLNKADVGLPNVDDTADVDKPVSVAQQAALDAKADDGHGHVAADVTFAPTGELTATDVQAALAELDAEKAPTLHSQDGSWVTFTPYGKIAATNMERAIQELEDEKRPLKSPIIESPFLSYDLLYKTSTDNALWKADRRWTVTHKAYRKSDNVYLRDLSTTIMFEDSYDSRTVIAATEYQILEMDFGGTWPGYSYGPFYINFYAGRAPDSVTVDVYTDYAPHGGPGWINLNAVVEENYGSNLLWRATSGVFQITKLRIRVDGNTSGTNTNNETSLCRVEWHLTRPQAYNSKAFIDKYGEHADLLNDFAWKNSAGAETARIGPGGLTAHPALTWNALPLINGWANYGSGYRNGEYAKDALGVVHLRGLISATAATSDIICTLPAGFRASAPEIFAQRCSTNITVADLRINQSLVAGRVSISGTRPDTWLSLSGVTFEATQ